MSILADSKFPQRSTGDVIRYAIFSWMQSWLCKQLLTCKQLFIVPTPLFSGEEELYTQLGFFCSVNFGRSIYSS